jgi:hypothetical protein
MACLINSEVRMSEIIVFFQSFSKFRASCEQWDQGLSGIKNGGLFGIVSALSFRFRPWPIQSALIHSLALPRMIERE